MNKKLFFITFFLLLGLTIYPNKENHVYAKSEEVKHTEWKIIDNNKYYLINGEKAIFWHKIDGEWYYFDKSGRMVVGWQNIQVRHHVNYTINQPIPEIGLPQKWFYLSDDGRPYIGWIKPKGYGYWYYLSTNEKSLGEMQTGWVKSNNRWFYLYSSGDMATGWIKPNGYWYFLDYNSGHMKTGWIKLNGYWYYLYPSGDMATGWIKLNGYWYYLYSSGDMATGWIKTNGYWYYLYPSGKLR